MTSVEGFADEIRRLLEASSGLGATTAPTELPELKRYGFRIGSLGLLVAERTRSEVVRAPVISTLPHSPPWLLGLMNLRGNLVPVADLCALCEQPSDNRPPATVLVLDTGDKAVAFPITDLPCPLTGLQPDPQAPALPALLATHAGPAFAADGNTWLDFDHEGFFRAITRGSGAPS